MPRYSYHFAVIIDRIEHATTRDGYSDSIDTPESEAVPIVNDLFRELKLKHPESMIGIKFLKRVEI